MITARATILRPHLRETFEVARVWMMRDFLTKLDPLVLLLLPDILTTDAPRRPWRFDDGSGDTSGVGRVNSYRGRRRE